MNKQAMSQSIKAPRYCSVTEEPMFEGWCVQDGEYYFKYAPDALQCAKDAGYADLEEAYEDGFMYYTDWVDIPDDEWDEPPFVSRLIYVEETYAGEMETWLDPKTDTYYHVPIVIKRDWNNIESLNNITS